MSKNPRAFERKISTLFLMLTLVHQITLLWMFTLANFVRILSSVWVWSRNINHGLKGQARLIARCCQGSQLLIFLTPQYLAPPLAHFYNYVWGQLTPVTAFHIRQKQLITHYFNSCNIVQSVKKFHIIFSLQKILQNTVIFYMHQNTYRENIMNHTCIER